MTEVKVVQGSDEWLEMRQCVCLTASKFGDAIGAGHGLPWDFLLSLINPTSDSNTPTPHTQHGHQYEPIINEAYQLLTGLRTEKSGFWLPKGKHLERVIGATPDAKVYSGGELVGLAEYKAPVYAMYKTSVHCPQGIPRHYMAQIQGQMAVTGQPWCDFMAVCVKSREVVLKRVYFQPVYWQIMAERLREFAMVLMVHANNTDLIIILFNVPFSNFHIVSKDLRVMPCETYVPYDISTVLPGGLEKTEQRS